MVALTSLIRLRSRARRSTIGEEVEVVPVAEAMEVGKGTVEDGVNARDRGETVLDRGENHGLVLDDNPGLAVPLKAPLTTPLKTAPLGGEEGREEEFDVMNKFSSSPFNPSAERACILDFFSVSLDVSKSHITR